MKIYMIIDTKKTLAFFTYSRKDLIEAVHNGIEDEDDIPTSFLKYLDKFHEIQVETECCESDEIKIFVGEEDLTVYLESLSKKLDYFREQIKGKESNEHGNFPF